MSFVAPEKNHFRVMLEGRDRDWQDVGTRRQAFYTDLDPGSYRFRVKGSNNAGVWNEEGASLEFSVAPAYYETSWFRAASVAILALLLWTGYRMRVGVIERHQAQITALNERLMKAQEQERMRIAGELHDGVMQQISAFVLLLGTAKRHMKVDLDAKAEVASVQEKLIELGGEVRQLSHDLHPNAFKETGLPAALRAYCAEFSQARGIPVTCEADESGSDLSRGSALALYRIAQEALGNAAKHAAPTRIEVRLTRTESDAALTVTDDGAGVDAVGGGRAAWGSSACASAHASSAARSSSSASRDAARPSACESRFAPSALLREAKARTLDHPLSLPFALYYVTWVHLLARRDGRDRGHRGRVSTARQRACRRRPPAGRGSRAALERRNAEREAHPAAAAACEDRRMFGQGGTGRAL